MTRVCLAIAAVALVVTTSLHARQDVLPGKIVLPEKASVPKGSRLRVSLHDLSRGVSRDAAVAAGSFPANGKKQLRFALRYIVEVIEPDRAYGVAAVVTEARGQRLWETRVPIRVLMLGNQKRVGSSLGREAAIRASASSTGRTRC